MKRQSCNVKKLKNQDMHLALYVAASLSIHFLFLYAMQTILTCTKTPLSPMLYLLYQNGVGDGWLYVTLPPPARPRAK
jgi:hypothetical protein